MWWSTEVNRVYGQRKFGGQWKLIEYMVATKVNRVYGGQRKLIQYVVVNGS